MTCPPSFPWGGRIEDQQARAAIRIRRHGKVGRDDLDADGLAQTVKSDRRSPAVPAMGFAGKVT
jgi:hypothetical protein